MKETLLTDRLSHRQTSEKDRERGERSLAGMLPKARLTAFNADQTIRYESYDMLPYVCGLICKDILLETTATIPPHGHHHHN